MKHKNPYRDEVESKLLWEYQLELRALADEELALHVRMMKDVKGMKDAEWQELLRKFREAKA